jgi:dihydrofolate reductase
VRKVVYLVAASLDGSIARADHTFDCFMPEGSHVQDYLDALKTQFTDVLMGRRTYEVGLRLGMTNPYPWLKSYVFSATMQESPDPHVTLVPGPPAEFVRDLKQQAGGNIYLCGGGTLAAALLDAQLIDEIAVKLNPLLIGAGIPMFSGLRASMDLQLLSSKIYDNGVLWLTYRPKYRA